MYFIIYFLILHIMGYIHISFLVKYIANKTGFKKTSKNQFYFSVKNPILFYVTTTTNISYNFKTVYISYRF